MFIMKRFFAAILVGITVLSLCACGAAPEATASPSPAVSATTLPLEPSAVPTPSPEPRSLTTGLPSAQEYKPITVMIENSEKARPQTGLQQADIVYEAMAEGNITRMLCVFNDQKPVVAGPVRSTRIYFINIQKEWDSPLVHYGGPRNASQPSYVYGKNTESIKVRVDGLKGAYNDYFWRDKSRSAPNNVYTDLQKIEDELYDYTPDAREQFSFDENVSYTGQTVDTVGIPFNTSSADFVQFKYDASTGLFTRYMKDTPFKVRSVTLDASGEQESTTAPLTVKNLIVQYAKTYTIKGDNNGRQMVEVTGKGDCEYYIGGIQLKGTWERSALDDSTHYYLEDGSPVVLQPGNTWIALQPTGKQTEVTYS